MTVICFQPTIHAADHAGAQPDRGTFLIIIHFSSFLSVPSVKIAAKPCKHGTLPDDRLRLFYKTAKPTAVCVSLKSPALRDFVAGLRALATAALYLVVFSNGEIGGENLRNGTWSGGKHTSKKTQFSTVGAGFTEAFRTSPTNAATFVSRGCGGYTRHPSP